MEDVTFDFGNLKVHRKEDNNDIEYPNYELKYPMYLLEFIGNYDTIYNDGPYQTYNDALTRYVHKISKMDKEPNGYSKDRLHLIEINLGKDGIHRKIIMCNKKERLTPEDLERANENALVVDELDN